MIIIDGYNLLYKYTQYETAEDLTSAVSLFADHYQEHVILVFDGEWDYRGEDDTHYLRVLYVADADAAIISLMKEYNNALIVTSDRDIIKSIKKRRCKHCYSEKFDISLPETHGETKPSYVTQAEVDELLNLFNSDTQE